MENKNGTISAVEIKKGTSAKGDWNMWMFTVDGKKYSTFDKKIGEGFKVNDTVEMSGEQKGEFWNMKTMMPFSGDMGSSGIASQEVAGPSTDKGSFNPTSMYVSYAKDVFVGLIANDSNDYKAKMELAIQLVKDAHNAFI